MVEDTFVKNPIPRRVVKKGWNPKLSRFIYMWTYHRWRELHHQGLRNPHAGYQGASQERDCRQLASSSWSPPDLWCSHL